MIIELKHQDIYNQILKDGTYPVFFIFKDYIFRIKSTKLSFRLNSSFLRNL